MWLAGCIWAIYGTHIPISKTRVALEDHFYFKTHNYTLNCQAVVDNKIIFLDLLLECLALLMMLGCLEDLISTCDDECTT
jgi:hypothetical protein